jgi:hypothetical protein
MLSIKHRRGDVLQKLVSVGAKVTVEDHEGLTPLAMASQMGLSTEMGYLLSAGAAMDDGSLHDAAREARLDAMRVLLKHGHDPDFPSDRHEGRSALAELCLYGSGPDIEETIECLVANGADIRLRNFGGKTIFHYALDSAEPVATMRVLLKLFWKMLNEDSFLFEDGTYTYSLTKYISKELFLGPKIHASELLTILRQKRAVDRFWATSIHAEQPPDIIGAPKIIMDEVLHQAVRTKRQSEMLQDTEHRLMMKRLAAVEEDKIESQRAQEAIRRQNEAAHVTNRITENAADLTLRLEQRAESDRVRFITARQNAEMAHKRALGIAEVETVKRIGEARVEMGRTEQMLQIEYLERRVGVENDGTRSRLAIEGSARDDADRIQVRMHEREMARLKIQKGVLDQGMALAENLGRQGASQRQIGYVMGEV